ncbi:hypothetical protein PHMEG_00037197 [Phytophthora megakarya]|uniref:Uncharacterized protein n=1 Tax=Phytophthora megakarya TaxID=4795 RepID=A0A225UMQ2_9STRA|nr:hypothetical protein PHMEG_00037197 [Phytophthora megakarya]
MIEKIRPFSKYARVAGAVDGMIINRSQRPTFGYASSRGQQRTFHGVFGKTRQLKRQHAVVGKLDWR